MYRADVVRISETPADVQYNFSVSLAVFGMSERNTGSAP
jgi:hypothetical protein